MCDQPADPFVFCGLIFLQGQAYGPHRVGEPVPSRAFGGATEVGAFGTPPSTAEMAQEPWPAEIAGPRFASFLESTLEQLLCKHRELLVAQFREVLKDDRVGPPVPSSRPPALAPMPGPEAPRLKESESFLAKADDACSFC
ncbi:hypothetical protein AK812_SmicGene15270 [Symbiodinium microadriaticum]|uniref:Uncharacterized protein n=1 Tax=Symbiodinium microadriaticum TaxID=2951 RepID=A0A1Q9E3H7_SYMMI|nr:hypothetical protein AK812_SmicGene15270 [Symbiodinium microadriaticum]